MADLSTQKPTDAGPRPGPGMEMNAFRALGTGVSALGYGAWAFSGELGSFDERRGIGSILAYLERGGNFIDTARAYGEAERIVGRALAEWTGSTPIIATKVQSHGPRSRWQHPIEIETVFPPGRIRESVEESRRQLDLDTIDILQLHLYWPTWGISGYWLEELHALRDEGLIRAIGVSIPDYRHDVALPALLTRVVDSVQTVINIFDPLALDCTVPLAREHDIAVIARGVLDEGGLTGAIDLSTTFEAGDIREIYFAPEHRRQYVERLERLRRFVPEQAPSLAALALRFVTGEAGVTTAIVSMPDERFVHENFDAVEIGPLGPEVQQELRTRHRWVRNFFEPAYQESYPVP
jgi:methylglyoxal reductase